MKSIRRLYFYLVAFISVEVVLWGLILLLRSILDDKVSGGAEELAQALALILVGVPFFLIHWLWAQRASARDEEEKSATLRAVFLYAILIGTLIPVVQNLLAFINRTFLGIARLDTYRAFLGGSQTLSDNLIAIVMNGIVAAYFWTVLRGEWATLTDPLKGTYSKENFSDIRRLYRYLWMLYGLLMVVYGAQQILRFLFYVPGDVLGELGREIVVNGTALLFVGTPIWYYTWRVIQDSLADPAERGSTLRLGILYLLALGGVITVISTSYSVVHLILSILFGEDTIFRQFIREIGSPLSIGIPLGVVWAYFGFWLKRHIESAGDKVRQASMKRLYNYILAFIGLVVAFIGVEILFYFLVDTITDRATLSIDYVRGPLTSSFTSLIVGLPLWLMNWRPMQTDALADNELGDHARRSVIRKFYIYLALFASVIGGMATAVGLVYQLIIVVLEGVTGSNFVNNVLNLTQLLFLFAVVLVYHLNVLRRDGESKKDALAEKQSGYSVLIVDSGDGFAESVRGALSKLGSQVKITVTTPTAKPDGNFNALVVSGEVVAAEGAPEWIRSFGGNRIIVEKEAQNLAWADDAAQASQFVRQLAEGEEIQKQKSTSSAWMIAVYVAAGLFALQFLLILLSIGISLVGGF
jgi:hypothetical protein